MLIERLVAFIIVALLGFMLITHAPVIGKVLSERMERAVSIK